MLTVTFPRYTLSFWVVLSAVIMGSELLTAVYPTIKFLRNVTLRQCVISSDVSICPLVLNVGTLFVVLQFTVYEVKHHNTASNVMWNWKLIFCNMYLTVNWHRNRLANPSCLRVWTDPAYWHLFVPLTFLWRILIVMPGQVIFKYRYKGFWYALSFSSLKLAYKTMSWICYATVINNIARPSLPICVAPAVLTATQLIACCFPSTRAVMQQNLHYVGHFFVLVHCACKYVAGCDRG